MGSIKYYSTNNKSELASFEAALMRGLGSHYGLYMIGRADIPKLEAPSIKAMRDLSYARIAFAVLNPFLKDALGVDGLRVEEVGA